ncbi:hypothetical protein VTO42DRAFT_5816 [Malbranchea cinnamomea]
MDSLPEYCSNVILTMPHISITPPDHREISFRTLPSEIHLQISSYLSYPDALALKHTNRYFYSLVHTDVALKVGWIVDRSIRRLQIPGKSCEFRSDEAFCKGEVRTIMEKRRWHLECKSGKGGCLVIEGSTCGGASIVRFLRRRRLGLLLRRKFISMDRQALVIAVLFCCIAILWQQMQGIPYTGVGDLHLPLKGAHGFGCGRLRHKPSLFGGGEGGLACFMIPTGLSVFLGAQTVDVYIVACASILIDDPRVCYVPTSRNGHGIHPRTTIVDLGGNPSSGGDTRNLVSLPYSRLI